MSHTSRVSFTSIYNFNSYIKDVITMKEWTNILNGPNIHYLYVSASNTNNKMFGRARYVISTIHYDVLHINQRTPLTGPTRKK